MKVKRYVVDSLPQAMEQIKMELGKDAIILHTKKIRIGGFLGLFGKEKTEVIAAVDQKTPMLAETTRIDKPLKPSNTNVLLQEVKDLKSFMVKMMVNENETIHFKTVYQNEMKEIYKRLIEQGVKEEVAVELLEDTIKRIDQQENKGKIIEEVKQNLINRMNAKHREIQDKTKILHFVGPTGVGKTTTIAKLAAEQVLKYKKRIAFITADTYRIAAVDQLKTYAEILNSPLEVVFSPQETQRAIDKLKDYDLIFMDTAGRNYHNEMYISELNRILAKTDASETFLVLSLTHKYEDMVSILGQFNKVKIDKLLFTKYDETLTYGAILNIIFSFPYKISYITNGQNVPDDIEVFNVEKLAKAILGV
ncbi:MAG: flagellar biosynthesis protein FlhF [Tepidibacillus sp.]|uniref:flagellar biosynthesis protein FlhF n=1 Tax=Tepidibacillus sp. HK-1 TaxID=1883407 RepID=UPI000852A4F5|nr:flagellar biosynthesis protein FlhF [Tepidibacillus sp. HK-1]GBF11619.1 flagellar biosynthesis protein FlhF [Tepidibacillus sp. HK-1]